MLRQGARIMIFRVLCHLYTRRRQQLHTQQLYTLQLHTQQQLHPPQLHHTPQLSPQQQLNSPHTPPLGYYANDGAWYPLRPHYAGALRHAMCRQPYSSTTTTNESSGTDTVSDTYAQSIMRSVWLLTNHICVCFAMHMFVTRRLRTRRGQSSRRAGSRG